MTLGDMLRKKGCQVTFLVRNLPGSINHLLLEKGFNLLELPNPGNDLQCDGSDVPHGKWRQVDLGREIEESQDALAAMHVDWLVVDHYGIWSKWHDALRGYVKNIMVIDDLGDRPLACDVLVDHNLGANDDKYAGVLLGPVKKMLGTRFCIIRPDFRRFRKSIKQKARTKRVVINFGGDDYCGYSDKLLESFVDHELTSDLLIDFVIGKQSENVERLRQAAQDTSFSARVFGYVDNMPAFLANADLAVGAAGGGSWERCCLGIPAIILPVADNQLEIASSLVSAGVAWKYKADDIGNGSITRYMNYLFVSGELDEASRRASVLVDGLGCERVAEIVLH
jgi:UDP-2,4-diacetamido-2,4,6-trideoxy-beta-L-altropyranose hydrolase